MRLKLWIILCFALMALPGRAQEDAMVKSIGQRFALFTEKAVQEKMYVHLDRPMYLIGETIWFKAYNLNVATHQMLDMSKVGYLEVLDAENNSVAQTKFSIQAGKGHGALLIPSAIVSGNYKVRCYTNWMKNFNSDYFFESPVTIVNPFVRFDPGSDVASEGAYDVQFFPEGGHLVRELESKVAFRATGKDGRGVPFTGALLNAENDTVARFSPARSGIGYFRFRPEKGENYKAMVRVGNGAWSAYNFPETEEQGFVMQLKDTLSGQLRIAVSRQGVSDEPLPVYLLSHTRMMNTWIDKKIIAKDQVVFVLDKNKLGEGISHLTILNEKLKPVCERLYFKNPKNRLNIEATSAKSFITREKVSLDLTASVGDTPAGGSDMSVSVYLLDSILTQPQQDISSYVWLTSDLRGNVEDPAYYFGSPSPEKSEHIDNLMLTHGWRRFRWEQVFAGKPPVFENLPEYDGHFIFGKVLNKNDSTPAKGIDTYLASLDVPARLYVSQSDRQGMIRFEVRKFRGPKEITLQTNLSRDSLYRYEVLSPFSKKFADRKIPAFHFDKTLENTLLNRAINMQTGNVFFPAKKVEATATLVDSLPFFGMPDEKYFLDDYTRFPTMEEVLREYVKGVLVRRRQNQFHFRMIDKLLPNTFYTTDPLMLVDGIPVFNAGKIIEFDPLKIKKIEVLNSRFFLGMGAFTGIVSFSTYRGDLGGFELDPRVLIVPYEGVQEEREFYTPKYDNVSAASRIPDFRNLMFWAPEVTTAVDGKSRVEFYTSDQAGKYQVVVQGITPAGVTGSQSFTFEVGKRNF